MEFCSFKLSSLANLLFFTCFFWLTERKPGVCSFQHRCETGFLFERASSPLSLAVTWEGAGLTGAQPIESHRKKKQLSLKCQFRYVLRSLSPRYHGDPGAEHPARTRRYGNGIRTFDSEDERRVTLAFPWRDSVLFLRLLLMFGKGLRPGEKRKNKNRLIFIFIIITILKNKLFF